jgi:hypothetical protein
MAFGRKNYLFAGADCGGERAASIYSLIGTAKLNGIDPEAYLRYVLTHTRRVGIVFLSQDRRCLCSARRATFGKVESNGHSGSRAYIYSIA